MFVPLLFTVSFSQSHTFSSLSLPFPFPVQSGFSCQTTQLNAVLCSLTRVVNFWKKTFEEIAPSCLFLLLLVLFCKHCVFFFSHHFFLNAVPSETWFEWEKNNIHIWDTYLAVSEIAESFKPLKKMLVVVVVMVVMTLSI